MNRSASQNTFEHPDLELILRGRPVDLPPLRVQIVAAAAARPESNFPRAFAAAIVRRLRFLASMAVAGLLTALAICWALTPLYTARASMEVIPPSNAEALIGRIGARGLLESPAFKLNIASLPEYTRSRSALNLLRRAIGLAAISATPAQDQFLRALDSHARVSPSAQGHLIDFEFEASDPPRAAAFLDLLTEEIVHDQARDQAEVRLENLKQAREAYAQQIAGARLDLQVAEEDLVRYARSSGLALESPAGSTGIVLASKARAEQSVRLASKRQEFESKRSALESLLKRARDAEAQGDNGGGLRRLAPAAVATTSGRPGYFTFGLLGTLSGLLLGIPLCLILEASKRSIRSPDDVSRLVGIQSLGVIPHASLRKTVLSSPRPSSGIIDLNPSADGLGGAAFFTSAGDWDGGGSVRTAELGESFRQVLASIWIAGQNKKRPRVLLFASPAAREGKTTIAANLGIALAHTRRRVLLIEADLRKPQMHAIFGAPARWGLANLLEEDDPVESYAFEDLVFKTDVPGLYVLPAGKGSLAIAGMRHIDRLTELLLRFRLEFHAVLIDTPAVSDYPDARIVARLSDAVVMVLRANGSSRDQALELARQFEADGTAVLGAVLNDCRTSAQY